jgi:hypothetical protein
VVAHNSQLALWLSDVGNTFLTKPRAESAVEAHGNPQGALLNESRKAARKLRFPLNSKLFNKRLAG